MESHNAKDREHIEITEEILKPFRLEPADRVVTLQHIETLAEIMNAQQQEVDGNENSPFNIEEACRTMQESVEDPTIALLDRDHPMYDESIEHTEPV